MSSSKAFIIICIQAVLIQTAFSQVINYGNVALTGVDFDVQALSTASAGLNGYLGNGGLINNLGLGLANGVVGGLGVGTVGLSGLGVSNGGLSGLSLGNVGVTAAGLNNAGVALGGLAYGAGVPNVAATSSVPVTGPFTATGNAELAVGGEFGVGGQAVVGGQIPVLGAVGFSGAIPASGVVSIAGNCGCSTIPNGVSITAYVHCEELNTMMEMLAHLQPALVNRSSPLLLHKNA